MSEIEKQLIDTGEAHPTNRALEIDGKTLIFILNPVEVTNPLEIAALLTIKVVERQK